MNVGAIIEKGLMDWQIVQQVNGKADIELMGSWNFPDELQEPSVWVRVVKEESGQSLIPWQKSNEVSECKWSITLKDIPAGGLYRIETCLHQGTGKCYEWAIRGDMIHHIGVGDIYVIAGQSNSAGYGKDSVYDPAELGIHLYKNSGKWDIATHPFNESTNTIHEVNREGGNPGHSPYLNFGKHLKRELSYPIGFIQSSLGGSPLSRWNVDEDGDLYKSMIESINSQGGKVAGVLWYQGCSDTATEELASTYFDRFSNMVHKLREDLNNENLPILTVQLNRLVTQANDDLDRFWSVVREHQRLASLEINDVYIIPTFDCPLSDAIHNSASGNIMIGERLAQVALSNIYKKGYEVKAPNVMSTEKIAKDKIKLTFENVINRLYYYEVGVENLPFNVEDNMGKVNIIAYEESDANSVILSLDRELEEGARVHGAYGQNPSGMMPIDYETHMPMLGFYNVLVK